MKIKSEMGVLHHQMSLTCWLFSLAVLPAIAFAQQRSDSIPREWVDAKTGHRVVRLSDVAGSASLYFHQNAYTPEGDKLLIDTPGGSGPAKKRQT